MEVIRAPEGFLCTRIATKQRPERRCRAERAGPMPEENSMAMDTIETRSNGSEFVAPGTMWPNEEKVPQRTNTRQASEDGTSAGDDEAPKLKVFEVEYLPVRTGVWTPEQAKQWLEEDQAAYLHLLTEFAGVVKRRPDDAVPFADAVGTVAHGVELMTAACVDAVLTDSEIAISRELVRGQPNGFCGRRHRAFVQFANLVATELCEDDGDHCEMADRIVGKVLDYCASTLPDSE